MKLKQQLRPAKGANKRRYRLTFLYCRAILSAAVIITAFLAKAPNSVFAQGLRTVSNANVSPESLALFRQGTSLLRANRNDEAMGQFAQSCRISPNFAEGHHEWAIALLKLGRNDEAIDQFNQAIAIDPNLAASWLSLGGAFQTAGKIPQAIAAYKNFVEKFPQDHDVPRVRNLIALLGKENAQTEGPSAQTEGMPPKNPQVQGPAAILGAAMPGNDYLADVTRQGVLRWGARRMPLKVFIEDGKLIPGYRPDFSSILKDAFQSWADASSGLVGFQYVPTPAGADVFCHWSANTAKFKDSAETAETKLYSDRYGVARGEIEILTLAPVSNQTVTDKSMRGTTLHEVGHVLGLAGHSKTPGDIMFFSNSLSEATQNLSIRDKNTLVRLYSER
jgi:tetratricopeptide (TPR) repeat protein